MLFLKKIHFIFVYLYVCGFVSMSAGTDGNQKRVSRTFGAGIA